MRWVGKFSGKVNVKPSRMARRLIALDEKCVKVNSLEYWVYAALDPINKSEGYRRPMACWNRTAKPFTLHYNHMRR